ncbi:MAG: hypothetical protein M1830_000480 [Pleopsidium flavum]|nr:MAG: hypothetical protein M1830_000480 [Pleopsidium flavum]
MTSQLPDNLNMEQKIQAQPVPSSDQMALDTDFSGSTKHDSSAFATASLDSSAPLPELDGISPANGVQTEALNEVNASAFLSNGNPGDLHLPEATSAISISDPLAPEASAVNSVSVLSEITETSMPTVVQPPTSDMRQDADPVSQEKVTEIKEEKQKQDLNIDTELAEGMALGGSDPIERTMATEAPIVDLEEGMDTSDDSKVQQNISTSELPHHPPVPLVEGLRTEAPIDPAPSPTQHDAELLSTDQVMQDVPPSPGKIARGREEDDQEDGPAIKRSRTDYDNLSALEFKVPDLPQPSPAVTNGNGKPMETATSEASQPIAKNQHKFILKGIQNIRRTKDAIPFNQPVDFVALGIPNYPTVVTKPMDLRTMEEKLKREDYPTIDVYIADFHQIVQNTHIFNGPEHAVTKSAIHIQAAFDRQMSNMPKPDTIESIPAEKKVKKGGAAAPKATPARRESRSSGGAARSPTATAGSPQTFALGPQGVPLIRRDSTVGDGRPKREIHPPPPRDLPYSNSKPKKKKYQTELKFCQEVMNELNKPKYQPIGYPFYKPVDPVALNIPHYHKIIKTPMDLGTISSKLKSGQYENAKEFESDVRLMFQNCYRFNPSNDPVNAMGKQFEGVFDDKWAEKKQWIEDHAPASGPQSPGSSPEPDDEDDEDEDDDDEEENQLTILQKQIAAMSKQVEMIQKKKSSPPAPSKKGAKGSKPARKDGKKGASLSSAPVKKEKKEKKATKPERVPWVTYEQKQDISNRINSLPESRMATALRIIRDNMPNLKGVQEDEIELDIDELSNDVLYKLLGFVRKYAPRADDSPPRPIASSAPSSGPNRPKKNKPMSKHEQEARISEIRGRLSGFQNLGSDDSPEPTKHDEHAEGTSGDEDDSEESEED